MAFNPNNLIFFYLILGLLAVGVSLTVYATSPRHRDDSRQTK